MFQQKNKQLIWEKNQEKKQNKKKINKLQEQLKQEKKQNKQKNKSENSWKCWNKKLMMKNILFNFKSSDDNFVFQIL